MNPALSNSSSCLSLKLGADFINNDYLGHMVLYGFNHYHVLPGGSGYLHPSGVPDSWVGNIAVAGNFI
ncbi:hypothetical protein ES703_118729 [subsurface metagenome]